MAVVKIANVYYILDVLPVVLFGGQQSTRSEIFEALDIVQTAVDRFCQRAIAEDEGLEVLVCLVEGVHEIAKRGQDGLPVDILGTIVGVFGELGVLGLDSRQVCCGQTG